MYFTLFHRRGKILVCQCPRIFLTLLFRECEDDNGKEVLLAKITKEVNIEVLIWLVESPGRASTAPSRGTSRRSTPTLTTSRGLSTTPRLPTPLATLRGCSSGPKSLDGRQTSCFPFLVLFPTECLTCTLVSVLPPSDQSPCDKIDVILSPLCQEPSVCVHDLVEVSTSVQVMLQRNGTLYG